MKKVSDETSKTLNSLQRSLNAVKSVDDMRRVLGNFQRFVTQITDLDLEHISEKFSTLLAQFARFLMDNNAALYGIRIMQDAVAKLSKGIPGIVTNLHAWLFALCLSAKRVDQALPYVDIDVANFFLSSQTTYPIQTENVLLFFHYGGLLKLAVGDYEGAAQLFEICVCMPAHTPSAIMIDSLKKLILINVILGRGHHLPSYRSPAIQRATHTKCQLYVTLALIHVEQKKGATITRLQKHIQKNQAALQRDGNWGLASKVYESVIKTAIGKLPSVFSQISLPQIAKFLNFGDEKIDIVRWLESFLQKEDTEIEGKLDMQIGTVRFHPRQLTTDELQIGVDLAQNQCVQLCDLVRRFDHALDLNPTMLARSLRHATAVAGAPTTSRVFTDQPRPFLLDDEGANL
ncbi:COP9 signalosome complex subunit 3 [Aphelenchoides besseyi]|nr:COP9 signalosome complex subunit 3 [Aphelenchoides besseyi]